MAIGILDKPLDSASVHRVEQAEKSFRLTVGQPVTQELIIQWVKHPAGCWKGIPPACRKVAVINQADSPELVSTARGSGQETARLRRRASGDHKLHERRTGQGSIAPVKQSDEITA
jgi:probable selenium-dependent hydroxylase accessory protein YqeC